MRLRLGRRFFSAIVVSVFAVAAALCAGCSSREPVALRICTTGADGTFSRFYRQWMQ